MAMNTIVAFGSGYHGTSDRKTLLVETRMAAARLAMSVLSGSGGEMGAKSTH